MSRKTYINAFEEFRKINLNLKIQIFKIEG